MTKLFNTTGTPLDSFSSEAEVRAALTALADADDSAIAALEDAAGVLRGRLIDERNRRRALAALSPGSDSQMQLALDALSDLYIEGAHLAFDGEQFWAYGGEVWRPLQRVELRAALIAHHAQRPERYGDGKILPIVAGAAKLLESLCVRTPFPSDPTEPPASLLAVRNGELWFTGDGDWDRRPHRSWTRTTSLSPVRHDSSAKAPLFEKALAEIFKPAADPDGMVRHVQELMGYAIQPLRPIPAIVVLRGAGANGKSFLLRVLAALFSEDAVLWGSVARLSSDRFTLPDLAGRRVFIDDDAKDGVRLDDGLLKAIAEDKPVAARRAHSPRTVSFRAGALPIISTNGAPSLADSSHGFERRLMVIPFERRFSEAEMDRSLAERIIRNELPGVLNLLLAAWEHLGKRGRFDEPADCASARQAFLADANPLRSFIHERCRPAEDARVSMSDLFEAYQSWRAREGVRTTYSRRAFTARLRSMGFQIYRSIGRPSVRGLELLDQAGEDA